MYPHTSLSPMLSSSIFACDESVACGAESILASVIASEDAVGMLDAVDAVGAVGAVGEVDVVGLRRIVRVTVDKTGETMGLLMPRRIATTGGRHHHTRFIASCNGGEASDLE